MIVTSSNFYQVGASLPVNAPSYVQRQADEEFYQKLQAGKFCYVLNSRQMGKSSLRVQTMQRLQKQETVCAAIDLTGIGKVTKEQWYGGIVFNLSESFQLEDKFDFDWQEWWEKQLENLSPVQCLSLFIEKILLVKIQQSIVIFVDEIDKVLSQDFSLDDFFALIRFFRNQRVDNPIFERLTFALLGVATPGDLITDKTQTPFNIGEAIELHGFKIDEVEPLIKGLQGRFDTPQKVMAEILDWTGGQPFLTQKLCKFMVEESEKDNPRSVEEVVIKRIIENWESQDNPEHLRTIRDRIISSEQRAGYLLELYQQIQQQGEIAANNSVESSELRLSGLVVLRVGKLRVYNLVCQQVFNQNWVETRLNNLRPYSENFRFWVASGGKDESRLLRGLALESAEEWAKDKNLSFQDKQFLAASKEKEIAVRNQEAELERERKDREAAEKINLELSEANRKAKRRIRNGTVVLVLALLGAVFGVGLAAISSLVAANKVIEASKTNEYLGTVEKLANLAGELEDEGSDSDAKELFSQAGQSVNIKDHKLKLAVLYAGISYAHQKLKSKDLRKAQDYLEKSQ
ncbi:MAG: AAA-like domain-containing protein, partial [Cyanobacteria bacterium J06628_3]